MKLWQLSATKLSSLLARGEASAGEVVRAHLERIEAVDGRLRAFTEVLRERALSQADDSDARRRRGEARGPLDGAPRHDQGVLRGRRARHDPRSSRRGAGASPRATRPWSRSCARPAPCSCGRTNLSQTMLYVEARNPIFGQTVNPWSASRFARRFVGR